MRCISHLSYVHTRMHIWQRQKETDDEEVERGNEHIWDHLQQVCLSGAPQQINSSTGKKWMLEEVSVSVRYEGIAADTYVKLRIVSILPQQDQESCSSIYKLLFVPVWPYCQSRVLQSDLHCLLSVLYCTHTTCQIWTWPPSVLSSRFK